MTFRIVPIVEGHGEVAALPILLRRLVALEQSNVAIEITTPIRVHKSGFINRDTEFERHMQLAAKKSGENGLILVLLDADDDCPVNLAQAISARSTEITPHRKVSVVIANREYEAWFIAAAQSLNGSRGLQINEEDVVEPETPRNAKGWLERRMNGRSYSETLDQPALSHIMDLQQATDRSRSFRKLRNECKKFIQWATRV